MNPDGVIIAGENDRPLSDLLVVFTEQLFRDVHITETCCIYLSS